MALKETLTPLKATNNATYKTVEGVTYFKLKSEFEGDYTKHCGLLGEEIDENFYFLRGYDIESITVDENRNLIINRVDKDYAPLVVNIGEELGQPKFKFNKENGTITVTYPDGTISTMDGFLVEGQDIRIATDSTLDGYGTMFSPLKISPVETTGTFAPANKYFDLTVLTGVTKMEKIPTEGVGYRVVTKELIDTFGQLYPFYGVTKIQEALDADMSPWRVPTKQDWDDLLNAFECEEDKNHNSKKNTWLGNVAGRALKSFNLWDEHKTLSTETPTYGTNDSELSVYPLGIGPDRNELIDDENSDVEGFGKIAGFWANTLNDEGNAYVKIFGYNSGKVDQDTYGDGARMSIRLVKDALYDNDKSFDNILGLWYPTKRVSVSAATYDKIWTTINVYFSDSQFGGMQSEEWSAATDSDRGIKTVYFVSEVEGYEERDGQRIPIWRKKMLENGDSVVIIDREGKPYHEWRIIDGELIDTTEALAEEFKKDFNEVKEDIAELSATTKELVQFSGWVVETINEFSAATEEHINRIDTTVSELSAATISEVARLDGKVNELSATTEAFSAATVAEVERLDANVAFVSGEVVTLSAATVAEVARLDGKIDELSATTEAFSAATVAEIERLDKKIDDETQARFDNDVTPGTYVLDGDASSEMVIPTNSEDVADVKIKVSDDFFNFGEF